RVVRGVGAEAPWGARGHPVALCATAVSLYNQGARGGQRGVAVDSGVAFIVFGFAAAVGIFLLGLIVTAPHIGLSLAAILALIVWLIRAHLRREERIEDRR